MYTARTLKAIVFNALFGASIVPFTLLFHVQLNNEYWYIICEKVKSM